MGVSGEDTQGRTKQSCLVHLSGTGGPWFLKGEVLQERVAETEEMAWRAVRAALSGLRPAFCPPPISSLL